MSQETESTNPPAERTTPRTDEKSLRASFPCKRPPTFEYIPADFARQLERELAAATERLERAEKVLEATNRVWFESKNGIGGEANEIRAMIRDALSARPTIQPGDPQ